MSFYVGILSNHGKRFNDEDEALEYAFEQCGIAPAEDWKDIDPEFADMLLEWFYSGDWIVTDDEDEAGIDDVALDREYDRQRDKALFESIKERMYWDAEQIRRGSRL